MRILQTQDFQFKKRNIKDLLLSNSIELLIRRIFELKCSNPELHFLI